ncbi:MAG TPA: low temperature requirement protein A [Streptosporangiaceae bacterium]|jgi:low temperature requirement protein LtrA
MTETVARPQPWLRRMTGRDPAEEDRASTPLELLFDLTLVVAVARAASQLQEFLAHGQAGHALLGYAVMFFALWWAWVNFTWFASAYDTDDVAYRLLTLLQMAGVLVFAAGIPAAFQHFDFATVVAGYVIMRLALVTQWLRAARSHPQGRPGTLRYAAGVAVVQAGWIARLFVPRVPGLILFAVLGVAELAVPIWAEFGGRATPWNADHISERYGEFTIIVLGEVVAATAAAVNAALGNHQGSPGLFTAAAAGLLLVFTLWWSYFKHSAAPRIRASLRWTFVWALGHYFIFAAIAALGAGLQVAVGTFDHKDHVSAVFAAFSVAIPAATFIVVFGLLSTRGWSADDGLTLLTAALTLAAAAAAGVVTLPVSLVLMVTLATLLLAYHLARYRRSTVRHGGAAAPGSGGV